MNNNNLSNIELDNSDLEDSAFADYGRAVRSFVDFGSWRNPVALSLTFRQCFWYNPSNRVWIDEIAASQDLNHLSNVLNAKLLRRHERRRGDRIGFFAVIERDHKTRLHAHALVECPDERMIDYLERLVAKHWPQTRWGYNQIVVKPCDKNWLRYMTKLQTKADYMTAHDWSVLRLPKKEKILTKH